VLAAAFVKPCCLDAPHDAVSFMPSKAKRHGDPRIKSTRPRRSLRHIVNPERIRQEHKRISRDLWRLEEHVLPPTDEGELERRRTVLTAALLNLSLACAVYVKDVHPDHFWSISAATDRWVMARLEGRECEFVVRRPNAGHAFQAFFGGPVLVSAYDALKEKLRRAWREQRLPLSVKTPRFVSRSGRYGEAQHIGADRFRRTRQLRAQALGVAVREVLGEEAVLPDKAFARIALTTMAPGEAALAALAVVLKMSRPTIRKKLLAGRKLLRRATAVSEVLRQRGWSSLAPDGKVIPSQLPRIPAGTFRR
jgi:hypothetical protein